MQGGRVDGSDDAGGEDTAPLLVTSDEPSSEPLAPLTDLSYDFTTTHRVSRARSARLIRLADPPHGRVLAVGAAVIVVAAAAIGTWALWPHTPAPEAGPAAAETHSPEVEQLRQLLPAGFVDDSCRPEPASPLTAAELICSTNADPSGPASARFLLAKDTADLQGLVRSTLAGAQVVTCPGHIQSPGPWRRNATPTQVAGTLICATHGDRAAIAWTTDAQRLVSVTEADAAGPSLAQLYTWWSSHS